ncbi:hypothetical protein J6590_021120 [Homalodisca vitripennis]|nr:hypothetical protein J6590_021120 [Homalodisca vitripennis]
MRPKSIWKAPFQAATQYRTQRLVPAVVHSVNNMNCDRFYFLTPARDVGTSLGSCITAPFQIVTRYRTQCLVLAVVQPQRRSVNNMKCDRFYFLTPARDVGTSLGSCITAPFQIVTRYRTQRLVPAVVQPQR